MATTEELMELRRKTLAPSTRVLIPAFPKIPDVIKAADPRLTEAWQSFDDAVEEWRKSIEAITS